MDGEFPLETSSNPAGLSQRHGRTNAEDEEVDDTGEDQGQDYLITAEDSNQVNGDNQLGQGTVSEGVIHVVPQSTSPFIWSQNGATRVGGIAGPTYQTVHTSMSPSPIITAPQIQQMIISPSLSSGISAGANNINRGEAVNTGSPMSYQSITMGVISQGFATNESGSNYSGMQVQPLQQSQRLANSMIQQGQQQTEAPFTEEDISIIGRFNTAAKAYQRYHTSGFHVRIRTSKIPDNPIEAIQPQTANQQQQNVFYNNIFIQFEQMRLTPSNVLNDIARSQPQSIRPFQPIDKEKVSLSLYSLMIILYCTNAIQIQFNKFNYKVRRSFIRILVELFTVEMQELQPQATEAELLKRGITSSELKWFNEMKAYLCSLFNKYGVNIHSALVNGKDGTHITRKDYEISQEFFLQFVYIPPFPVIIPKTSEVFSFLDIKRYEKVEMPKIQFLESIGAGGNAAADMTMAATGTIIKDGVEYVRMLREEPIDVVRMDISNFAFNTVQRMTQLCRVPTRPEDIIFGFLFLSNTTATGGPHVTTDYKIINRQIFPDIYAILDRSKLLFREAEERVHRVQTPEYIESFKRGALLCERTNMYGTLRNSPRQGATGQVTEVNYEQMRRDREREAFKERELAVARAEFKGRNSAGKTSSSAEIMPNTINGLGPMIGGQLEQTFTPLMSAGRRRQQRRRKGAYGEDEDEDDDWKPPSSKRGGHDVDRSGEGVPRMASRLSARSPEGQTTENSPRSPASTGVMGSPESTDHEPRATSPSNSMEEENGESTTDDDDDDVPESSSSYQEQAPVRYYSYREVGVTVSVTRDTKLYPETGLSNLYVLPKAMRFQLYPDGSLEPLPLEDPVETIVGETKEGVTLDAASPVGSEEASKEVKSIDGAQTTSTKQGMENNTETMNPSANEAQGEQQQQQSPPITSPEGNKPRAEKSKQVEDKAQTDGQGENKALGYEQPVKSTFYEPYMYMPIYEAEQPKPINEYPSRATDVILEYKVVPYIHTADPKELLYVLNPLTHAVCSSHLCVKQERKRNNNDENNNNNNENTNVNVDDNNNNNDNDINKPETPAPCNSLKCEGDIKTEDGVVAVKTEMVEVKEEINESTSCATQKRKKSTYDNLFLYNYSNVVEPIPAINIFDTKLSKTTFPSDPSLMSLSGSSVEMLISRAKDIHNRNEAPGTSRRDDDMSRIDILIGNRRVLPAPFSQLGGSPRDDEEDGRMNAVKGETGEGISNEELDQGAYGTRWEMEDSRGSEEEERDEEDEQESNEEASSDEYVDLNNISITFTLAPVLSKTVFCSVQPPKDTNESEMPLAARVGLLNVQEVLENSSVTRPTPPDILNNKRLEISTRIHNIKTAVRLLNDPEADLSQADRLELQKLLEEYTRRFELVILIKWRGLSHIHATWELPTNAQHILNQIQQKHIVSLYSAIECFQANGLERDRRKTRAQLAPRDALSLKRKMQEYLTKLFPIDYNYHIYMIPIRLICHRIYNPIKKIKAAVIDIEGQKALTVNDPQQHVVTQFTADNLRRNQYLILWAFSDYERMTWESVGDVRLLLYNGIKYYNGIGRIIMEEHFANNNAGNNYALWRGERVSGALGNYHNNINPIHHSVYGFPMITTSTSVEMTFRALASPDGKGGINPDPQIAIPQENDGIAFVSRSEFVGPSTNPYFNQLFNSDLIVEYRYKLKQPVNTGVAVHNNIDSYLAPMSLSQEIKLNYCRTNGIPVRTTEDGNFEVCGEGNEKSSINNDETQTNEMQKQARGNPIPNPSTNRSRNTTATHGIHEGDIIRTSKLELKRYQVVSVNRMLENYCEGRGTILADEMGLGKTVQIVSLLYIITAKYSSGIHLIIAPLSTISNWLYELNRFAGGRLNVVVYVGNAKSRALIDKYELCCAPLPLNNSQSHSNTHGTPASTALPGRKVINVILTTLEVVLRSEFMYHLNGSAGGNNMIHTLAIDEAHLLKNRNGKRYEKLFNLKTKNRVLITGTPSQNTLEELYNLLLFIQRDVFIDKLQLFKIDSTKENIMKTITSCSSSIDRELMCNGKKISEKGNGQDANSGAKESTSISSELSELQRIMTLISPFFIRRTKSEVERELPPKVEKILRVGTTALQRSLYKCVLTKNKAELTKISSITHMTQRKGRGDFKLLNVISQLKKVCNHPYLIHCEYTENIREIVTINRATYLTATSPKMPSASSANNGPFYNEQYVVKQEGAGIGNGVAEGGYNDPTNIGRQSGGTCENMATCDGETAMSESADAVGDGQTSATTTAATNATSESFEFPPVAEYVPQTAPTVLYYHGLMATSPLYRLTNIIRVSGKFLLLYNLILKLYANNSKILVFSTMTSTLDLIEYVFQLMRFRYERLDGRTQKRDREEGIRRFNADPDWKKIIEKEKETRAKPLVTQGADGEGEDETPLGGNGVDNQEHQEKAPDNITVNGENLSDQSYLPVGMKPLIGDPSRYIFAYLLSTKAGGLGINLSAANNVIIMDNSYNPYNDIQAYSRAHRIGQTKKVTIYSIINSNTIEENITDRNRRKRIYERIVVGNMGVGNWGNNKTRVGKGVGGEGGTNSAGGVVPGTGEDQDNMNEMSSLLRYRLEKLFDDPKDAENDTLEEILERADNEVDEDAEDVAAVLNGNSGDFSGTNSGATTTQVQSPETSDDTHSQPPPGGEDLDQMSRRQGATRRKMSNKPGDDLSDFFKSFKVTNIDLGLDEADEEMFRLLDGGNPDGTASNNTSTLAPLTGGPQRSSRDADEEEAFQASPATRRARRRGSSSQDNIVGNRRGTRGRGVGENTSRDAKRRRVSSRAMDEDDDDDDGDEAYKNTSSLPGRRGRRKVIPTRGRPRKYVDEELDEDSGSNSSSSSQSDSREESRSTKSNNADDEGDDGENEMGGNNGDDETDMDDSDESSSEENFTLSNEHRRPKEQTGSINGNVVKMLASRLRRFADISRLSDIKRSQNISKNLADADVGEIVERISALAERDCKARIAINLKKDPLELTEAEILGNLPSPTTHAKWMSSYRGFPFEALGLYRNMLSMKLVKEALASDDFMASPAKVRTFPNGARKFDWDAAKDRELLERVVEVGFCDDSELHIDGAPTASGWCKRRLGVIIGALIRAKVDGNL